MFKEIQLPCLLCVSLLWFHVNFLLVTSLWDGCNAFGLTCFL